MFHVRWSKISLNKLTNYWLQADSVLRRAITASSHQIELHLKRDPHNAGESRPNNRRILHIAPLGVIYRIEPDGKTVSVLQLWMFQKRKKP